MIHKTADFIILVSLGFLFLLGGMSFFWLPIYKDGVWLVLTAISSALSGALGFKFGVTTPGQSNGQTTKPEYVASHSDAGSSASGSVGESGDAH